MSGSCSGCGAEGGECHCREPVLATAELAALRAVAEAARKFRDSALASDLSRVPVMEWHELNASLDVLEEVRRG